LSKTDPHVTAADGLERFVVGLIWTVFAVVGFATVAAAYILVSAILSAL
jgi:phage shock protein PspC (stress-responsive transcriptional regulator)